MSTCFCGCGEPAEMECSCGYFISIECQCDETCNVCDYNSACEHCESYIKQLDAEVHVLYATRQLRALTSEERTQVLQLQDKVRDDWHRSVLACMLNFA